jgi:uncharacterized spore protein YtfJ
MLKTCVDEIKKLIQPDNIVGEKIVLEDKTLIPITKIGGGFGSGAGSGKGKPSEGEGTGGGGGGGFGVQPVALIVVFKGVSGPEGLKILPIEKESGLIKAVGETLPKIADAVKSAQEEKQK